jgi:quercetin dioxygenase-like cupin family protein
MNARLASAFCWVPFLVLSGRALSQPADGGVCRPVSERKTEVGCWILANDPVGVLREPQAFWYLDVYPTRAAAVAGKSAHGTVVEALGKVWLLSIDRAGWRSARGQRVAEIGPIPIRAGDAYSAQYMEAVFTPGMTAPAHRHGGPEIWYTASGETCLETPEGKFVGRAGGPPVIVPEGPPMHLTATGTDVRRALVLILHGSSKPATTMAHDWTPKGLCKQ